MTLIGISNFFFKSGKCFDNGTTFMHHGGLGLIGSCPLSMEG